MVAIDYQFDIWAETTMKIAQKNEKKNMISETINNKNPKRNPQKQLQYDQLSMYLHELISPPKTNSIATRQEMLIINNTFTKE